MPDVAFPENIHTPKSVNHDLLNYRTTEVENPVNPSFSDPSASDQAHTLGHEAFIVSPGMTKPPGHTNPSSYDDAVGFPRRDSRRRVTQVHHAGLEKPLRKRRLAGYFMDVHGFTGEMLGWLGGLCLMILQGP